MKAAILILAPFVAILAALLFDSFTGKLESLFWRFLHRKACPGAKRVLREEIVSRRPAFQCPDFWVENRLIDMRVQCQRCGRVHQIHVTRTIRHEETHEEE